MKILIIGGTVFLGRHLVEAALARGHEVTLFNRGRSNPNLFPEVEKLRGDRDGDLGALHGRRWDVAIDTCGYVPRIVRQSAELLADAVDHYTFISTISVYADGSLPGVTETSPLSSMDDETVEEVTGETYGPLKVLCEREAETAMPGRVLIIRPGLIVGPNDPTDRFTYWPVRVDRGGELLLPGRPEMPVQVIDVRDLAEWNIRLVEAGQTGIYQATGPAEPYPFREVVDVCQQVAESEMEMGSERQRSTFTWVDEAFLLEAEVGPWMELPLWLPDPEAAGVLAVNVSKAVAAGLTFRPLAETVADTLAWASIRPADYEWRAGLKPEREQELLQAWRSR